MIIMPRRRGTGGGPVVRHGYRAIEDRSIALTALARPHSRATLDAAARTVAGMAADAAEATELLDMLGLLPHVLAGPR
jgi:hypothetical protein